MDDMRRVGVSRLEAAADQDALTRLIIVSAIGLLVSCSVPKSGPITCPLPQLGENGGDLFESPQAIAAAGARLRSGSENAILEIAGQVRTRQPNASRAEIVNYLVTAYCPEVNRRGALDASAKRDAVRAFASRADKVLSQLHRSI